MPGDAVKFGEAFVEVHAKLENYEREITEAETRTRETVIRIRQEAGGDGGGGGNGFLGNAGFAGGFLLGRNINRIRRTATLTQRMIGLVRTLGRGLARLFWPVLLISESGRFLRILQQIPDFARKAWEAILNFDVSDFFTALTSSIDGIISRIPLIGHLWRGVGITISEISGTLGFSNLSADIAKLKEETIAGENALQGMARAAQLVRDTSLQEAGQQERRRGILAGLTGTDRIRAEEFFNMEDLDQAGKDAGQLMFVAFIQKMAQLRGELESGALDQEKFDEQAKQFAARRARLFDLLDQDLEAARAQARATAAVRIRQADQEAAMTRASELETLHRELALVMVNLELEGSDARAEAIRIGYLFRIMDAEREGETARAALLARIGRARIEAIRQTERERWDAQMEAAAAGKRRTIDRIREALTDINRVELELGMAPGSDRSRALGIFDINADAGRSSARIRRQIDELREAQAQFREALPFGLITDEQFAEHNAFAAQIAALEKLLALTELLRRSRIGLADQRAGEREGGRFRQVNVALDLPGKLAAGSNLNGGDDRKVRLAERANEHLRAIQRSLEDGRGAVFN